MRLFALTPPRRFLHELLNLGQTPYLGRLQIIYKLPVPTSLRWQKHPQNSINMSNPAEIFKGWTQQADDAKEAQVEVVYDALTPVDPEFMFGAWKGGFFPAPFNKEHASHAQLLKANWAGKVFMSTEDVNPIIVYDENGKRVVTETWGHARLRKLEYRGVVSTAMIYDILPVIDTFRYVDENTLAGVMDAKGQKPYYFFLERLNSNGSS